MTAATEPVTLVPPERRARHLVAYGVMLSVALVALPVLTMVGLRALLDSRDGEVIDPVLDPAAPGYQALVSPSPTLLVVQTDPDGSLVGVTLMAMAGDEAVGGALLLVPPSTVASVPEFGDLTLEYVQPLNGTDTTYSLTEWILGLGIDEVVEMDRQSWIDLTVAFDGLIITNPDDLVIDGEVRFPAGQLVLAPDEVGIYLELLQPGENPLNRLLRQELVWAAFLAEVADAPGEVTFAGEQDRGLARFVPAIAGGPRRIVDLPVTPASAVLEPGESLVFTPDGEAIAELIPRIVPFPAGARPGDRPLVRVLDGSGRQEVIPLAVRHVAIGGGQVVMIGNADNFDHAETQILYSDETIGSMVRSVADTLGVGNVQLIDYIDESAEVIVILGADYQP